MYNNIIIAIIIALLLGSLYTNFVFNTGITLINV